MKYVRSSVAFALALFFVACGGGDKNANSERDPGSPNSVKKTVTILSWDEYFAPGIFEQFAKETGIEVAYETFEELDELEALLNSNPGKYDVVVADGTSLERFIELRLVRPLERDKVPNFANVDPAYLGRAFDPENVYSAPYTWGTTLVAYRADKIDDPQESWSLLWDEKLKGKVMVLSDRTEALGIALLAKGYSINSENETEILDAADSIVEQIADVDVRFGSDIETKDAIDSGEVWAAVCYSGDAGLVASENENVGFFIPEEGAPLWMDNFAVASASGRGAEAHALINFLLRADVAAENANFTWYASPNLAARKHISEELLGDTTINPSDEVRNRCKLFEKPDARREELLNEGWLRVQEALRERGQVAGEAPVAE